MDGGGDVGGVEVGMMEEQMKEKEMEEGGVGEEQVDVGEEKKKNLDRHFAVTKTNRWKGKIEAFLLEMN